MCRSLTSKLLSWSTALAALVAAGAGLVFLIWAVWRSTLPYNSEGNYFDGVVNYHEHSVAGFGLLAAAAFLIAGVLLGFRFLIQRSRRAD